MKQKGRNRKCKMLNCEWNRNGKCKIPSFLECKNINENVKTKIKTAKT